MLNITRKILPTIWLILQSANVFTYFTRVGELAHVESWAARLLVQNMPQSLRNWVLLLPNNRTFINIADTSKMLLYRNPAQLAGLGRTGRACSSSYSTSMASSWEALEPDTERIGRPGLLQVIRTRNNSRSRNTIDSPKLIHSVFFVRLINHFFSCPASSCVVE